ncbi:MAG: FdhF/YdeP family oxidoreductase [Bacteroidota bacterium]
MLKFINEIILLATNDDTGRFNPIQKKSFNLAIAGAVLFELSFSQMIDNDLHDVFVVKNEKSGDNWLDKILDRLILNGGRLPILKALSLVELNADEIVESALNDLQKSGVLIEKGSFWNETDDRRYYKRDLKTVTAIRQKIRQIVLEDVIPDPENLVTLNLIQVCNLSGYLFSAAELEKSGERIRLLSNLELIGQNILREIKIMERMTASQMAGILLDFSEDNKKIIPGGMAAVRSAMKHIFSQTGIIKATTLLSQVNQKGGFDCPSCSWPDPDQRRSPFEFCENGVKSIAGEATDATVSPGFFEKWTVDELQRQSEYWLEQQGRLISPMILREGSNHYVPVTYTEACNVIAENLADLNDPDEAVFYTSGKASNESSFLFQLLARNLGTNNLPGSSNLCHDPSGAALLLTLGSSKGTVDLDDFEKADSIFIFGHNPASNHPRMMKSLESAVKRGCTIVVVNPMVEPGLVRFRNPQNISIKKEQATRIAHLYVQPAINGDLAFVKGMIKYIFEEELKASGGIIDQKFISDYTAGYEGLKEKITAATWDEIVAGSGVQKTTIEEAAKIYLSSDRVIASWCLGITHHKNAVATIREIINLMLLRGNIGKPGAGLCPVRGHSNVQGNKTMGVNANVTDQFLERLSDKYGIEPSRKRGLDAVSAIRAMFDNKVKTFISLGGNPAAAAPDNEYTKTAFNRCDLTVLISTKLNKTHFITGKTAIILPCLGRTEKDIADGMLQSVTYEDLSGVVRLSRGCVAPVSEQLLSEVQIIAMIAGQIFGNGDSYIPWKLFSKNYSLIREHIAGIIPEFGILGEIKDENKIYRMNNPVKQKIFNTKTGKAMFSINLLNPVILKDDEFLLMSVRSHDQFNTSVFGMNDRYRGIKNERKVVFLNADDMHSANLAPGKLVNIRSYYDDHERSLSNYFAVPHKIPNRCAAIYFPEANALTSINEVDESCMTPAYKSIVVKIFSVAGGGA